jgi:hypothetical protein
LERVVGKQDSILHLETLLQVFTVENCLELLQKLEGVLDVGDNFKVFVDVSLERGLN